MVRKEADSIVGGPLLLIGGGDHPHAARRLRHGLPLVRPGVDPSIGDVPEETGSEQATTIRLVRDPSLVESAYVIAADGPDLVVRGGLVDGIIQGVERLLRELRGLDAIDHPLPGEEPGRLGGAGGGPLEQLLHRL